MGKRSDGFEKSPRGFYPTPWDAFEPLAPQLPRGTGIIDPCAGDGQLCHHLANAGMTVSRFGAFDIAPRHSLVQQRDARKLTPADLGNATLFVTNPPWPLAGLNGEPTKGILLHLSSLRPTWALLPSDFMFNVYAGALMLRCHAVLPIGRVKWIPGSKDVGKENCAWFLFGAGAPSGGMRFIPRAARQTRQARPRQKAREAEAA
jgi:hypothetical protein